MKFVPFDKHEHFESRALLLDLVRSSPSGQTFGEMEKRLKIKAALSEAPAAGVILEDADHANLLDILNNRRDIAVTDEGMFAIYTSVRDAKAPTKAQ